MEPQEIDASYHDNADDSTLLVRVARQQNIVLIFPFALLYIF